MEERDSDRSFLSTISKFKKWHHHRFLRYDSCTTTVCFLLDRGKHDDSSKEDGDEEEEERWAVAINVEGSNNDQNAIIRDFSQ